jgi:hypothetical protein
MLLPAAFAPFLQVRAFRAEGGVVAVPGVNPRRVGQAVEYLCLEAAEEGIEVLRVCCPPRTAGEQGLNRGLTVCLGRAFVSPAFVASSLTSANGPDSLPEPVLPGNSG